MSKSKMQNREEWATKQQLNEDSGIRFQESFKTN